MLLSCTWLAELLGRPIDVSEHATADTPFSAAHIANRLTSLGLEVEGLGFFELPGVIVGRVDSVTPHPESSKLSVVALFDGSQTVQVVCGASNLPPPGGNVAFAPVGVTLPNGLTLSPRVLKGVESQGMICSEQELDIGGDGDGILVLPQAWEPGALLQDVVPGIRDAIIEISVTPNRPDALGHLGVARDLALALGCELQVPTHLSVDDVPRTDTLVELPAGDRCPRYLGFALEDCTIGPAPLWMRVRLHRVGLRAIDNVVDVTNFVLMEIGQPMHAFDRARLAGQRVVVRRARAGEPMTLLDGTTTLELCDDDLVIADAESPQALAGVMGGQGSMVEANTKQLLLEVAYFEPRAIRRTARRYELATDSSHRFERQVDWDGQLDLAARRALHLLREHGSARCVAWQDARGQLPERATIALDPGHVGRLLGMDIADSEVARILTGLGVEIDRSNATAWTCIAPSFRPDLTLAVDLVEEVMRHHGLDDLPARHSSSPEQMVAVPEDPQRQLADALADGLRSEGLHEHLGLAFIAEDRVAPLLGEFEGRALVRPINPMSNQQGCMRPHLLPGLLDVVARNQARHGRALGLFEVGRIYLWPDAPGPADDSKTGDVDPWLPHEPLRAAAIRARRGLSKQGEVARVLSHDLLASLARVGLHAELRTATRAHAWLHPGIQAAVWVGDVEVGLVGELHPDVLAARDLSDSEVAYGELWIEAMPPVPFVRFQESPRFPATNRDLSLDLDARISASDAVAALRQAAAALQDATTHDDPPRLSNADDLRRPILLIEDYRGEGIEPGRRALLLRLHYRALHRSVTDTEVQALHDTVVARALEQLKARDPAVRVR